MITKILYIHGFNSTGNSIKTELLKKEFPDLEIIAPTLDPNPIKALHSLIQIIIENDPHNFIIIGTSLGGFYTLCLRQIFDTKCIVINPSLKPHEGLKDKVGIQHRYDTGEGYKFKEKYLKSLEIYSRMIQKETDFNGVSFYFATDDEVINHTEFLKNIKIADKIATVNEAGHRFSKFEIVIDEIKTIIK